MSYCCVKPLTPIILKGVYKSRDPFICWTRPPLYCALDHPKRGTV